ncbi:XRE family transcriptional regulator [Rhizobium leguminosarum]|uniref:helix-turn-helix domain-containing protein n=1 Tax=Rhizobium leguminosarum TaxID=384 RepID=UPI001030AEFA|nr:helix-turn-helix transcriptional regulator [Rhizobium leguminosarum]TBG85568.1 XRE family transcriptional regulator [Rhizobium leguminosarum]
MDTVHRLLHAAREVLGLKQSDVAEATAISTRTLNRIENGSNLVSFETLARLRDYYGALGVTLVEQEGGKHWALEFSRQLAPPPETADGSFKIYDPLPGSVLKAARILVGMNQEELSSKSSLAHTTIRRLEKSDATVRPEKAYLLQRALEEHRLVFVKPTSQRGWLLHYGSS